MAAVLLTLTDRQLRSQLHEFFVKGKVYTELDKIENDVDRVNALIHRANAFPSTKMHDDAEALRRICSSILYEFAPNRVRDALTIKRDEGREKRKQQTEARKARQNGGNEAMGTKIDAGGDDHQNITPADTTKTALRNNATGVRWIPEDQGARLSRTVPHTEEAKAIPVSTTEIQCPPDAWQEVTPWQLMDDDYPPVASAVNNGNSSSPSSADAIIPPTPPASGGGKGVTTEDGSRASGKEAPQGDKNETKKDARPPVVMATAEVEVSKPFDPFAAVMSNSEAASASPPPPPPPEPLSPLLSSSAKARQAAKDDADSSALAEKLEAALIEAGAWSVQNDGEEKENDEAKSVPPATTAATKERKEEDGGNDGGEEEKEESEADAGGDAMEDIEEVSANNTPIAKKVADAPKEGDEVMEDIEEVYTDGTPTAKKATIPAAAAVVVEKKKEAAIDGKSTKEEKTPSQPPRKEEPKKKESDNSKKRKTPQEEKGDDDVICIVDAEEAGGGEEEDYDGGDDKYRLLLLVLAFGENRDTEKNVESAAKLNTVWREVYKAICRLEGEPNEDGSFNYSVAPPVTNFFDDRNGCAWLIHRLNVINFITEEEANEALDDVEANGIPTRLLKERGLHSEERVKSAMRRITRSIEAYIKDERWTSSSSKASKNKSNIEAPKTQLDFVPATWLKRYCDVEYRLFCDLNDLRRVNGLSTIPEEKMEEALVAEENAALIAMIDERREEEDDDEYQDEAPDDDSEARTVAVGSAPGEEGSEDDEGGEYDDTKHTEKKKSASKNKDKETAVPRKDKRKQDKPSKLKNPGPVNDGEDDFIMPKVKKSREDKDVGEKSDEKQAVSTPPVKKTPEPKKRREGSPLPTMKTKLRFVAETACPNYEEIRETTQNGKNKTVKQLQKEMDGEKSSKKARKDDGEHVSSKKTSTTAAATTPLDAADLSLASIKSHLPQKLQPGLTRPKLSAGLKDLAVKAAELVKKNNGKNINADAILSGINLESKSITRVVKDAHVLAEYHINTACSKLHDAGMRSLLRKALCSPSMYTKALSSSAPMPDVCRLTGKLCEKREELSIMGIRASDNSNDIVTPIIMSTNLLAYFTAINLLICLPLLIKEDKDLSVEFLLAFRLLESETLA